VSGLTLYLNNLGDNDPLPAAYVAVPDVVLGPGMGELICPRCDNAWAQHRWVVFLTADRTVLDCSEMSRVPA
jgi:hypothetical protein